VDSVFTLGRFSPLTRVIRFASLHDCEKHGFIEVGEVTPRWMVASGRSRSEGSIFTRRPSHSIETGI